MTYCQKTLTSLCALTVVLCAGCIHHHETIYKDENRASVEFENDAAAREFYQTVSRLPSSYAGSSSDTRVSIPFVFKHETEVRSGPYVRENKAIKACDTNHDGMISEEEARKFAKRNQN